MLDVLTINLEHDVRARLQRLARDNGVTPVEQVHRLIGAATATLRDAEREKSPNDERSAGEVLDELRRRFAVRFKKGEIVRLSGTVEAVDFSGPEYGTFDDEDEPAQL